MRRSYQRIIIAALLALVLGAVTTVALAWAIAEWRPLPNELPMAGGVFMHWEDPWPWSTVERSSTGITVVNWARATGAYVTSLPETSVSSNAAYLSQIAQITPDDVQQKLEANLERVIQERPGYVVHREAPRWGTFVQSKPPPDGQVMGSDTAFGWPMRCMWYQMQSQYGMNRVWGERLYGGIVRSGQPSAVMRQFRALPLLPIWPGLVGNTLFYGVIWFMLLLAPGAVQRMLRRRRGRCEHCGYPIGSSPICTECGGTLPAASRRRTQTLNET